MTVKPLIRKALKITGITLGILLVLTVAAYIWFIHHAESIVRDIVHRKSKGTVALTFKSISWSFGEHRLDLKKAVLYNTDSLTKKTAYHISVEKLSLQLHAIMPLVFHRQLVIDSILINDPAIRVIKSDTALKKRGSLTTEIGNVYHSIHKALSLFEVGYFSIRNGQFTLANNARPDWQPVTISHIDFSIDNFQVGGDNRTEKKFLYSDNIVFRTHDQQFTFPDGRYNMAFSRFRIDVRQRLIEMDSCSFSSNEAKQQKNNVDLFFHTLRFTGIHFDTLYHANTLDADSMYAIDPVVRLTIYTDSSGIAGSPLKEPVNMDTLLQHLGMDLKLNYMGVKNIQTSVVSVTNGQAATFNTKGDDFALRDVKVDRSAPEPVSIGGFDMSIRGYSGRTQDSAYTFRFDSIRLINSRVLLRNLSITSAAKATVQRHHQLPLFELDNLSWEELIFHRRIRAQQAVLYDPVIHYVKRVQTEQGKKISFYSILNSLNNTMSLDRIRVIDGHVSYRPDPDTRLLLEQVNLTVSSNRLLAATTSSLIGSAVDSLRFVKGSIYTKDLQADIRNGHFTGDSAVLEADEVIVKDRSGRLSLNARAIRLTGIDFDDSTERLRIDTISWKEAGMVLHHKERPGAPAQSSPFSLTTGPVRGGPTRLSVTGPRHSISTVLTSVAVQQISKDAHQPLTMEGLAVQGRDLLFTGQDLSLRSRSYTLTDRKTSRVQDVYLTRYTARDSITIAIPQVQMVPDIPALMAGKIAAESITLEEPSLHLALHPKAEPSPVASSAAASSTAARTTKPLPPVHIKQLLVNKPSVTLEQEQDEHTLYVNWAPAPNNHLLVNNIVHQGEAPLTIGRISLTANTLSLARHSAHPVLVNPHSIQLDLESVSLATAPHHPVQWSAILERLAAKEIRLDGLGKDSGALHLSSLNIGHLAMQAGQHYREWLNHSPDFEVKELSGSFKTNKDYFYWQQLGYRHRQRLLSLDTFSYTPVLSRDAYIAAHPFQTDYIQLQTGPVSIHNPDLHGYFLDTMAHIATVQVQHPAITVYRDKRPPFQKGVIKPLPVSMIAALELKLKVDSVLLHDGHVEYEEFSDKTGQAGKIVFTRLDASLSNIKSHDHRHTDSLKLHADAYLLDAVRINLRLHESYTDSLAAFYMTTRVSGADLTVLNKVVEPLASVKIRSGHLDSLTLSAVGREYLSYGKMNMRYRKLYVQFLKKGEPEKRSFMTRLVSTIANTFVIKAKNEHKTGIIYFERYRDRSIFNYMIKMFLSGAGSSIGAKSNKKYIRRYKRELQQQQLPPIHLD